MPSGTNPALSCSNQDGPIQLQLGNGCAAGRCKAYDERSVFVPLEVLIPYLLARVIQWDSLAGMWIHARHMRLFGAVAIPASKAEVVKLITAAQCLGIM